MRRKTIIKYLYSLAFFVLFFWGNNALADHSVLRSASEHDYPPLALSTEEGEASGFSVELLKAALEKKGRSASFYLAPWSEIKSSLAKGELDVLPLVGRTPEREDIFDFTVPYLTVYGNLFIRSDLTDIKTVYDLHDKEILVMQGDNAHEYVLRKELSNKIFTTESFEDAFKKLSQGEHDAIICLGMVGNNIIKKLDLDNVYSVAQINDFRQDFSFAVTEGNSELLNTLNDGLSQVIVNGSFDTIYQKWFGAKDENFQEFINYEAEASQVATNISGLLDEIVKDAQEVASYNYNNLESAGKKLKQFYDSKNKDLWFNIGSDENVISQTLNTNLYKEISFINKEGIELIKIKDGDFIDELKDISQPENTTYKSETYWQDTKSISAGKVNISRLYTDYTSKDEVFADMEEVYYDKYEKVIARDIMKQGYMRFSSPVYDGENFKGIVSLALDYRHIQELVKHIEPGNPKKVISASYSGNYVLMYDIDGDTIVHPKPDNIRGYLEDGTLAAYNDGGQNKNGNIFNLYAYSKSEAYPKMAQKTLEEKSVYTSSALDVSGRTKLTIAVPIVFANQDTNYRDIGVFGGIMLSVSTFDNQEIEFQKTSVKLKALETAKDISSYLQANPNLNLKDLQNDVFFKKIAIQKVNENGYTAILNATDGVFYFHPQEKLINQNLDILKEDLPEWWRIMNRAIGEHCRESDGLYRWKEEDGEYTEKYLYAACIETKTADNKKLLVIATSYLDEADANKYVNKYSIGNEYVFARDFIKQRAFDIGRQIEIYMQANPDKTLRDLKNDPVFQETAVQSIGRTGYTYLVNHNTGMMDFHPDPKIRDGSYDNFKERFPVIWDIIDRSIANANCEDSEGFYEWADIDGKIRDKYTYHHCLETRTADGYKFFIGASTYLDEYDLTEQSSKVDLSENTSLTFTKIFAYILSILLIVILVFLLLFYFKIISFQGVTLYVLLGITYTFISFLFLSSSYLTANNLKTFLKNNHINQNFEMINAVKVLLKKDFEHINNDLLSLSGRLSGSESDSIDLDDELKAMTERSEDFVYASYRINKDSIIENMYPIDENSLNADIGEQEHMIRVQSTLRPVTSNIFDAVEGFKAVTSHYPVFKENNYDGTVAMLIDLDSLLNDLDLIEYQGSKDDFFILDSDFNIISSGKKERIGKNINEVSDFKDLEIVSALRNSANVNYLEYTNHTGLGIVTFSPVYLEDNTWYLLQKSNDTQIFGSAKLTLYNIWLYTFWTLFSLALLGFGSSFLLTRSLRKEINLRTMEVKKQSKQIKEQLTREAEINNVNKKLIKEQKKAKQELEEKVAELEKFQKLIVNREIKMIELKDEVAKLKKEDK